MILTSTSQKAINTYVRFFEVLFKQLKITSSIFSLPTKIKKIHLLKSPHVYKKAKEHFEMRTYKKIVTFELSNDLKKTKISDSNSCEEVKSKNDFDILKCILSNKPKTIKLKLQYETTK